MVRVRDRVRVRVRVKNRPIRAAWDAGKVDELSSAALP